MCDVLIITRFSMSSAGGQELWIPVLQKKESFYMILGVYNTNQQGHLNGAFPVSINTP